eukprot:GHVT01060286.1.p1 GENE.GHVT01060286.1~~GHVT01060286.1.p1  ORF type:complete len:610 (+),score=68.12 GHVT01060286.1:494-2323(+)
MEDIEQLGPPVGTPHALPSTDEGFAITGNSDSSVSTATTGGGSSFSTARNGTGDIVSPRFATLKGSRAVSQRTRSKTDKAELAPGKVKSGRQKKALIVVGFTLFSLASFVTALTVGKAIRKRYKTPSSSLGVKLKDDASHTKNQLDAKDDIRTTHKIHHPAPPSKESGTTSSSLGVQRNDGAGHTKKQPGAKDNIRTNNKNKHPAPPSRKVEPAPSPLRVKPENDAGHTKNQLGAKDDIQTDNENNDLQQTSGKVEPAPSPLRVKPENDAGHTKNQLGAKDDIQTDNENNDLQQTSGKVEPTSSSFGVKLDNAGPPKNRLEAKDGTRTNKEIDPLPEEDTNLQMEPTLSPSEQKQGADADLREPKVENDKNLKSLLQGADVKLGSPEKSLEFPSEVSKEPSKTDLGKFEEIQVLPVPTKNCENYDEEYEIQQKFLKSWFNHEKDGPLSFIKQRDTEPKMKIVIRGWEGITDDDFLASLRAASMWPILPIAQGKLNDLLRENKQYREPLFLDLSQSIMALPGVQDFKKAYKHYGENVEKLTQFCIFLLSNKTIPMEEADQHQDYNLCKNAMAENIKHLPVILARLPGTKEEYDLLVTNKTEPIVHHLIPN